MEPEAVRETEKAHTTSVEPTLIGVRELKNEVTRVVREVRETQAEYIVTVHGEPAAVIRPFTPEDAERLRLAKIERYLKELDELAEEVGKAWISPKSGVELLEEEREGRWQSLMRASKSP